MKTAEQAQRHPKQPQKKNPKNCKGRRGWQKERDEAPSYFFCKHSNQKRRASKEADRKREPPAVVESRTILSQNVTDARPLCSYGHWSSHIPDHYALAAMERGSDSRPLYSYGDWSVQTPDQLCTYGYGRAWTLHHYAVYRSWALRQFCCIIPNFATELYTV